MTGSHARTIVDAMLESGGLRGFAKRLALLGLVSRVPATMHFYGHETDDEGNLLQDQFEFDAAPFLKEALPSEIAKIADRGWHLEASIDPGLMDKLVLTVEQVEKEDEFLGIYSRVMYSDPWFVIINSDRARRWLEHHRPKVYRMLHGQ